MKKFKVFEDIIVWNCINGEGFKVHKAVYILKTFDGLVGAVCGGDDFISYWTHAVDGN